MRIRRFATDLFSRERRRGGDDPARRRRRGLPLGPSGVPPGILTPPPAGGSSYPGFLKGCDSCYCPTPPCLLDGDCCGDTPPAQMDVTLPNIFTDIGTNPCALTNMGNGTCPGIGGKTYTLHNFVSPMHPQTNWVSDPGDTITTPKATGWVYQVADYLEYTSGTPDNCGPVIDFVLGLHFRCFQSTCQWFLQLSLTSACAAHANPPSVQIWGWTAALATRQAGFDCNFTSGTPLSLPYWPINTFSNVYCHGNGGAMAFCHPDTTFHSDPITAATIIKH